MNIQSTYEIRKKVTITTTTIFLFFFSFNSISHSSSSSLQKYKLSRFIVSSLLFFHGSLIYRSILHHITNKTRDSSIKFIYLIDWFFDVTYSILPTPILHTLSISHIYFISLQNPNLPVPLSPSSPRVTSSLTCPACPCMHVRLKAMFQFRFGVRIRSYKKRESCQLTYWGEKGRVLMSWDGLG